MYVCLYACLYVYLYVCFIYSIVCYMVDVCIMYVLCMFHVCFMCVQSHHVQQTGHEPPEMDANPGDRSQSCLWSAEQGNEFGLARRVRSSRPASVCLFFTLRLNLVLTHGIPLAFRHGIYINSQPPSGRSRVYRVTELRTDDVQCRESAGTGPVSLKVVPATGAAFPSPWTN